MKTLKAILFLTIFGIFHLTVAGEHDDGQLSMIDLSKAGKSATVEVHISRVNRVLNRNPTTLALQIIAPHKDQENLLPKFRSLIMNLTGTSYPMLSEQEISRPAPHKEIKFHVLWRDKNSGTILRERNVSSGHDWQGKIRVTSGPSFTLDSMNLTPGDYEIIVTTLIDDDRFDGEFKTGLCTGVVWK